MTNNIQARIGIIGTVGVPAKYGGFETLAHQLVKTLGLEYQLTVYCSQHSYLAKERKSHYNGAKLVYLPIKANGPQSILYDIISMIHAMLFCDILLILGVSGCLFLPIVKFLTGKRIIVNIDGLEWRRAKWSGLARFFLRTSEWMAARYADEIITDNAAIQKYTMLRYGRHGRLITYGADHTFHVSPSDTDIQRYSFLNQNYAFKVCRIEPENMLEIVLDAFSRQERYPLVIVGNWTNSLYGVQLRHHYQKYENLHLLDSIYDDTELNLLRSNCAIYIHGHSAGGTNPSLVEAMYLGLPVLAYNVIYNRITTQDAALYFSTAEELIVHLLDSTPTQLQELGHTMETIASTQYTWDNIALAYAEVAGGKRAVTIPQFDFDLPIALQQYL